MKTNHSTTIKFKDKNNNLSIVKIKLEKTTDKETFSMTGECNGSAGQCDESIEPLTKAQKRLMQIWKEYHLNDINAGTIKQDNILEDLKNRNYDKCLKHLNGYKPNGTKISAIELQEVTEKREKLKTHIIKLKNRLNTIEETKELKYKTFTLGGMLVVLKELELERQFFQTRQQLRNYFLNLEKKEQEILTKLQKELDIENKKTLLYDTGADGKLYQYGATWHHRELPKDLWDEILSLKNHRKVL